MRIIVVHGFRPLKSGDIHPDLKNRLDRALELDKAEKFDAILVSGNSRKSVMSEARQAEIYLKDKTNTPLIVEDRPHSTSEEVRLLKERFKENIPDKAIIIVSQPYVKRTKYLYKVLWPESVNNIVFEPAKSGVSPFAPVREVFYRFYTRFDPYEKFLPAKLFKRLLRS